MSRLDELLSKEMTRRQFLVTIGLGFASIFGLSAILGTLAGDPRTGISSGADNGYGDRSYGR